MERVPTSTIPEDGKPRFLAFLGEISLLDNYKKHILIDTFQTHQSRLTRFNIIECLDSDCLDSEILNLVRIFSEYTAISTQLRSRLIKDPNSFKNLVDVAKTGEKELQIVMECLALIFYRGYFLKFASFPSNILLVKDIVLLVNEKWEDEHLVHCLVTVITSILSYLKYSTLSKVWRDEIIPRVSNIFIKMYAKDPALVGLQRQIPSLFLTNLDGQIMSQNSSIMLWFRCTKNNGMVNEDSELLQLIPIIASIFQEFKQHCIQATKSDRDGIGLVGGFLDDILELTPSNSRDHKVILKSECIVHLIEIYNRCERDKWDKYKSKYKSNNNSSWCFDDETIHEKILTKFLYLYTHVHRNINTESKIAILPNLVAIISCKKMFDVQQCSSKIVGGLYTHGGQCKLSSTSKIQFEAEHAIGLVLRYIVEEGEGLLAAIIESGFVPCFIDFARYIHEKPHCILKHNCTATDTVSKCFCVLAKFAVSLKFRQLTVAITDYLSFASSSSWTGLESERKRDVLVSLVTCKQADVCYSLFGKVCDGDILSLKYLIGFDVCSFEAESKIFLTYLEGLTSAKFKNLTEQLIEFLCKLSDIEPKLLSPYFTSHIPDMLKRMCGNNRVWKTRAIKMKGLTLIHSLALHAKLDDLSEISLKDLETLTKIWITDITHPISPGGLKLSWFFLTRSPNGPLSTQLRKNTPVDGKEIRRHKNENEDGLRYIIDTIVTYLDKDPAYPIQYLISLTKCIVDITKATSLEDELILLEDLVSPAMWLPKRAFHEEILANVKEFLSLIH